MVLWFHSKEMAFPQKICLCVTMGAGGGSPMCAGKRLYLGLASSLVFGQHHDSTSTRVLTGMVSLVLVPSNLYRASNYRLLTESKCRGKCTL